MKDLLIPFRILSFCVCVTALIFVVHLKDHGNAEADAMPPPIPYYCQHECSVCGEPLQSKEL